jgi:hypothetical protein
VGLEVPSHGGIASLFLYAAFSFFFFALNIESFFAMLTSI